MQQNKLDAPVADTEELIKKAMRLYMAEWRKKSRDHIREYSRIWRQNNPDKVKAIQHRFWSKKVSEYGSDLSEEEK